MNKLSFILLNCFLLILVSMSWCASVHADLNREYQLKAAYLLNFARFIYWPEQVIKTADNFNICVIGESPFDDSLDKISNKKIKNKKIKIIYSKSYIEGNQCHIIYISKTKNNEHKDIIKKIGDSVVLTVSDIDGFALDGGMIGFVRIKNKIKFEINVDKSIKSNIKYRSQLLEVAETLR
ncbi:MAG: YfiR family protein [Gammaproteobacteria bacterium]|nr:YfiR family protein [Gammaproteobacteria bacterium]